MKLAWTAAYVSRYLTKEVSGHWMGATRSGLMKHAWKLDDTAEEVEWSEQRQVTRALRKAQKAMRKSELEKTKPKVHRSIKLDPVSNSAMRQAFKRDIQKALMGVNIDRE